MAKVATITRTGGPDVIEWRDVALPPPGAGEVRMCTAVGLNYIDTCHRRGIYPIDLPSGLGVEAAGVVEAFGEGVAGFTPGDGVATFGPALGAYATERNVAAATLFSLPTTSPPRRCSRAAPPSSSPIARRGSRRATGCWSTPPPAESGCRWSSGSRRAARG